MTQTPREIRPEVLYSIKEAQSRLGWGRLAWLAALKAGLRDRVRYVHGRGYILGEHLIAYLMTCPTDQRGKIRK